MKKILTVLLMICLLFSALPLAAHANGPVPMPELHFVLDNLPEGTAYVDLAVKAPKDQITDLAQQPPVGLSEDCPLVRGEYDGYVSYTFRVRDARSDIVPDEHNTVSFAHENEIPQWGKVCLVMADAQGEILKISQPFDIEPKGLFENSLNYFEYDANSDSLLMDTYFSIWICLFYIIISLFGMAFTCGVEWGIGLLFRITAANGGTILKTNACSQTAMRILFLLLYSLIPQYVLVMVLLEILVYIGEFLVYQKYMYGVSKTKCLWYVFTANTASLLLGLLLNLYFV